MNRARRGCAATGLWLGGAVLTAAAAEVQVDHQPPRYHVEMRVRIDAPPGKVYAAFADVRLLPQVNPAVREVRVLESHDARAQRVYTRVRLCVALFCRDLRQVQDMRFDFDGQRGEIRADVLPALSDVRFGTARWDLQPCGEDHTCLHFRCVLEPDFWVPPMVGPWMIQRVLEREAQATAQGLARVARAPRTTPTATP